MDDLSDLMWADSKPKPTTANTSIGTQLKGNTIQHNVRSYDAFSALASASNSRPSYTTTSYNTPAVKTSPNVSPLAQSPVSISTSQDAFGSLFSLGTSSNANLSIADRQAKAQRDQLTQERKRAEEMRAQGAFWDRFDSSLSTHSNGPRSAAGTSEAPTLSTPFLSPTPITPTSRPSSAVTNSLASKPQASQSQDTWGDFDLLSPSHVPVQSPTPSRAPSGAQVSDPFDFATFEEAPVHVSSPPTPDSRPRSRQGTPGDFDFGDREYGGGLLDDTEHDADPDDILGDLGRPVETLSGHRSPVEPLTSPLSPPNRRSTTSSKTPSRSTSPPPHIIGQIVEMGFSPHQARVALAATDSGVDVQTALESLLSAADRDGSPDSSFTPSAEETERHRREEEERERRRKRRAGPSRNPERQTVERQNSNSPNQASNSSAPLRDQADKVLMQASEIGLNVFNRANAFWTQGKAQLQKAYEERKAASSPSGSGSGVRHNSRPRWAADSPAENEERYIPENGFRDDDHSVDEPPKEALQKTRQPPRPALKPHVDPPLRNAQSLFGEDQPTASYVSPHRRRPMRNAEAGPSTTGGIAKASDVSSDVSHSAAAPIRKRTLIPASLSTLSASKSHRAKGTEMYKLGRFAEAESSYSSAIDLLPSGHLALIPLFNNRATARIKTGDHTGAIKDCIAVIDIIGTDYHPNREAPVPPTEDGDVINLAEAFVKAFQKRAEAYESVEKWAKAKEDWEKLVTVDWAAGARVKSEALRGVGRCRRMLDAGDNGAASSASARPAPPKPKPKPAPLSRPVPPSEAVNRLRAANTTQDAEELERVQIKDNVDARLSAWKAGKESNLRALIGSLDTILWAELGWQKVGMSELVTPSQVKIKYMRAIGRVHPDKLSAMKTSLDQRMIANGVFGALNEAWNTFKP